MKKQIATLCTVLTLVACVDYNDNTESVKTVGIQLLKPDGFTDNSGLGGRTITLIADNGKRLTATTDANGLAKVNDLTPNIYNISASWEISGSEYVRLTDGQMPVLSDAHNFTLTGSLANQLLTKEETVSVQMLANAIERNASENIPGLSTSACGSAAIFTLLIYNQRNPQLHVEHILYRNSGDSEYGDHERVVGYHSFIVYQQPHDPSAFTLSPQEKQTLLKIARSSIEDSCRHQPAKPVEVSENLKTPLGAFVTLHKNGRLRGCIGHFGEDIPLYKTVSQMARSAAFEDPRFPAVTSDEMKDIEIEISVLTPLKRISDISEFKYGFSGAAATGTLTADDFTSLTIFVVSGGITGTECNPVIKIDNIRAVPNK